MREGWWDERATAYDRLAWVRDSDLLRWQAGCLDDALRRLPRRLTALDIGCGTGALTEALVESAARVGARLTVNAFDDSGAMLDRATAKDIPGAAFHQSSDLEWKGSGYDLVASRMVLHHMEDVPGAVARWFSRVNPGGALVVVDGPLPHADRGHPSCQLYQRMMSMKEPGRLRFTAADVSQAMLDAGASEVTAHETWGPPHSVANWLDGNGASWVEEPWRRQAILFQLRESPPDLRLYLRVHDSGNDIHLRWRQCVVVGQKHMNTPERRKD